MCKQKKNVIDNLTSVRVTQRRSKYGLPAVSIGLITINVKNMIKFYFAIKMRWFKEIYIVYNLYYI